MNDCPQGINDENHLILFIPKRRCICQNPVNAIAVYALRANDAYFLYVSSIDIDALRAKNIDSKRNRWFLK